VNFPLATSKGGDDLTSCFEITQVSAKQSKNRRESAAYYGVNEHFEPIFNAVLCQLERT
jgi:hypothetical protein